MIFQCFYIHLQNFSKQIFGLLQETLLLHKSFASQWNEKVLQKDAKFIGKCKTFLQASAIFYAKDTGEQKRFHE